MHGHQKWQLSAGSGPWHRQQPPSRQAEDPRNTWNLQQMGLEQLGTCTTWLPRLWHPTAWCLEKEQYYYHHQQWTTRNNTRSCQIGCMSNRRRRKWRRSEEESRQIRNIWEHTPFCFHSVVDFSFRGLSFCVNFSLSPEKVTSLSWLDRTYKENKDSNIDIQQIQVKVILSVMK